MDGFSIAAGAIRTAGRGLDVTANNIANVSTPGFRADEAHFETGPGGRGVDLASITESDTPGPVALTGRTFDLALRDNSFFAVRQSRNSSRLAFTRDGSFGIDARGRVVTAQGDLLDPEITVPTDATSVSIDRTGAVTATRSDGSTVGLGNVQPVRFSNPAGLGNNGDNLLLPTPASGPAARVPSGGSGEILEGALTMSNTDIAREMVGLIRNERMVQMNAKVIQTNDEIQKTILDLKG